MGRWLLLNGVQCFKDISSNSQVKHRTSPLPRCGRPSFFGALLFLNAHTLMRIIPEFISVLKVMAQPTTMMTTALAMGSR